jgi:hypothetical protein
MVSGYCGLHLAQIGSKSRAVQLLQGLEAQSTIATDNNRDLVPFPKPSLTQAIGGEPDRQAVTPAADRLLEVPARINRWVAVPGLHHRSRAGHGCQL